MKTYNLLETKFFAADEQDLVQKMRKTSYNPETTQEEYMKQFSRRVMFLLGIYVRYDTPKHFVDDLAKNKLLSVYLLN